MRTAELQTQLDEIERQLQALDGDMPSEVWFLVPIATAPCPPLALARSWLAEAGLGDLPTIIAPSRQQVIAPLVHTPGFTGQISAPGWHFVSVEPHQPVRSDDSDDDSTAWYHPTLTARFHEFLEQRQQAAQIRAQR